MSDERWKRLELRENASAYVSQSQSARLWSEGWVRDNMFCPACGEEAINKLPNNSPVADFACGGCDEQFELKSQRGAFRKKIVDGAFRTMSERLRSLENPNLLLMRYSREALAVSDLIVVPKHFFTPQIIEARKPLGPNAKRAGWQGCNILLDGIPDAGRIWLVRDSILLKPADVRKGWQRTLFLRDQTLAGRGWLIEVLNCVEAIPTAEFTLQDVYSFEGQLKAIYPGNANVRPKIRQQLQVLRDRGLLEFLGSGRYRRRGLH
jgi:type II restriction enzyme